MQEELGPVEPLGAVVIRGLVLGLREFAGDSSCGGHGTDVLCGNEGCTATAKGRRTQTSGYGAVTRRLRQPLVCRSLQAKEAGAWSAH